MFRRNRQFGVRQIRRIRQIRLDGLSRKLSGRLDRLDNSRLDRLDRLDGLDRLDRYFEVTAYNKPLTIKCLAISWASKANLTETVELMPFNVLITE